MQHFDQTGLRQELLFFFSLLRQQKQSDFTFNVHIVIILYSSDTKSRIIIPALIYSLIALLQYVGIISHRVSTASSSSVPVM